MATVEELVDHARTYYDNMGDNDAGAADLNNRIAAYLTQVIHEINEAMDWPYLETLATVTVDPGAYSEALPTDFWKLGGHGSLFHPGTRQPMAEVPVSEIVLLNNLGQYRNDVFAISGDLLYVCTVSASTAFKMTYLTGAVTTALTYNPGPWDPQTNPATAIPFIPARYHYGALLSGLILKVQEAKNDSRDWRTPYERALARMKAAERTRSSAQHRIAPAHADWSC